MVHRSVPPGGFGAYQEYVPMPPKSPRERDFSWPKPTTPQYPEYNSETERINRQARRRVSFADEAGVPKPALLPKPVAGFEIPHPQDGHRFGSRVFTIINTVTKHEFFAHEHVLAQSPVLMKYCREHKGSLRLKLPADVEDSEFRRVLEYLYTGKLHGTAHCAHYGAVFMVQELVELYVLASRLGLGVLMAIIVGELEKQDFLKSNPTILFTAAERIYPATPKSDRTFKDFFVAALTSCYENCEDFPQEDAEKLLMAGGPLALDIYQAQRAMNIELRAEVRAAERERRRY